MISSSSRSGARPAASSASPHHAGHLAADELHRRQVDRHLDMRRQGRRIGAGLPQHPFAERQDQPGLLGDGDELRRRDRPARRMGPAQQRLEPGRPVLLQVDDRLVGQRHRAGAQRLPQVGMQQQAPLALGGHRRGEEADAAALLRPGAEQRQVGMPQQRSGCGMGRSRSATAMPMVTPMLARYSPSRKGRGSASRSRRAMAAARLRSVSPPAPIGRHQQQGEFVAVQPRHQVARLQAQAQPLRRLPQQRIAHRHGRARRSPPGSRRGRARARPRRASPRSPRPGVPGRRRGSAGRSARRAAPGAGCAPRPPCRSVISSKTMAMLSPRRMVSLRTQSVPLAHGE